MGLEMSTDFALIEFADMVLEAIMILVDLEQNSTTGQLAVRDKWKGRKMWTGKMEGGSSRTKIWIAGNACIYYLKYISWFSLCSLANIYEFTHDARANLIYGRQFVLTFFGMLIQHSFNKTLILYLFFFLNCLVDPSAFTHIPQGHLVC